MDLFVLLRSSTQLDWAPETTFPRIVSFFASLSGSPDQTELSHYSLWALLLLYSILVIIGIVTLSKSPSRSVDGFETWYRAFFLSWFVVPILLALAISARKPVLVNRYLMICLPPFIILAACGCSQLRRPWPLIPLLSAIAALTVPGLVGYYHQPSQDWRGLAQYLLSNQKPGDAALLAPPYFGLRMTYYLNRKPYLQRSTDIQSDAYFQSDFPNSPASTGQSKLALLVPDDDNSYAPLLHNLSSRYVRVWLIERQDEEAPAQRKRSVETALAAEFSGLPNEKIFSGGLEVILYQNPQSQGSGQQVESIR
jgi:hypothetical protein